MSQQKKLLLKVLLRRSPKTALITGGAVRVGREISLHLARRGYRIIVHYYNSEAEAKQLVEELNALNNLDNLLVKYDLMKEGNGNSLFQHISVGIDLLVNNAAFLGGDKEYQRIMQVNFNAPISLTNQATKQGAIVINLLDKQSIEDQTLKALIVYHLSKFAVFRFTENFKNGRVHGLALGAIMYKTSQNIEVYNQVKVNYSSNLEALLVAIDQVIDSHATEKIAYIA